MKKKALAAILCALLAACGGRTANPISIEKYGDTTKSCESLALELDEIDKNIHVLQPDATKTVRNVTAGVAGLLIFPPLALFMDVRNAEDVEVKAYKLRYNRLLTIATERKCGST